MLRLRLCFVVVCIFANSVIRCDDLSERVYKALDRTLDFILENHRMMNLDALFGVILAQGHLKAAVEKSAEGKTKQLLYLCEKTRRIYDVTKPLFQNDSFNYQTFNRYLVVPEAWERRISFKYGKLNQHIGVNTKGFDVENCKEYLNYLSTSQFLEIFSDQCIMELLAENPVNTSHFCFVSVACRRYMIDHSDFDPLYGVTHKLLYLQIGRSRNCTVDKKWFEERTKSYCSYILWEAKLNAQCDFIKDLDDIFLEQVVLCGFEGYSEFFTRRFIEHVLDIQTPEGCFTTSERSRRKRSKRETSVIKYGCMDHTTGLAAGVLSIFLRYLMTNDAVN